ncbi:RNA 2',3'-cyclic phosphodiesterase [Myxococcota bacterium]|nr:RNA 2',3'-cyclic phosphodiesterase [Myxococcota bacterium]MBU1382099.1 RNA 2',3'-cyclic phosphodiesterase [Myxococcota bacterium]MBU1498102.1 RNA 2',3'-cyclic phosphodiesterase [Myxococcota bacterium]
MNALKNSTDTKRLFVAIPIAGEAAVYCLNVQNSLKAFAGDSIRYTGRNCSDVNEKFHLTLEFLGDTSIHEIDDITERIERAVNTKPFSFSCGNCKFFGSPGNSGSVFISVKDETGELDNLNRSLKGFSRENFHPHITIGRRKSPDREQISQLISFTDEERSGPRFTVSEIVLFSSDLNASGPVYTALKRVPVGNK